MSYNFKPVTAQYPGVIAQMPDDFTAHEFIQRFSRQNQTLYIEALYAYRHTEKLGVPAPFMIVHGILAQRLADFPDLIQQVEGGAKSIDIFGQENGCSRWQKVGTSTPDSNTN